MHVQAFQGAEIRVVGNGATQVVVMEMPNLMGQRDRYDGTHCSIPGCDSELDYSVMKCEEGTHRCTSEDALPGLPREMVPLSLLSLSTLTHQHA